MDVLGISAFYHDSAAALLRDGEIVAAAQEERFTRRKHDAAFPANAIRYCLDEGKTELASVDHVVFYDKPLLKFERLLETYIGFAPRGFKSFRMAMPIWLREKLFLKTLLRRELSALGDRKERSFLFTEHHQSHAASAFFASPFESAAVLCLDGVGEWATTSAWTGSGNGLTPLWTIDFPHSLGLLYSAFTYYTGFRVNSGEYKLMGLAPYGEPRFADTIREHLIDVRPDGTFRLDMSYFNYATGLTMTNARFDALFGRAPRQPEQEVTQLDMDLARSIQVVTEEVMVRLARTLRKETGERYLCLAGGVALNCVANGLILREGIFDDLWIQPAAGDAGGSLGAAYAVWHQYLDKERETTPGDTMRGAYLGPAPSNDEIRAELDAAGAVYEELDDAAVSRRTAEAMAAENVVGWVQGRMEFGPRALGARSIIGDARSPRMQSVMNLKIKYRESFRPFAPAVLSEHAGEWFEIDRSSPYMLLVADVAVSKRRETGESASLSGIDKLKVLRSEVPAVTHVDYSARLQTVHKETNPKFHRLISDFHQLTGCPVVINTSFNVRGEPIVCTASDAYRCFMNTEMDFLAIGNFFLDKTRQPAGARESGWVSKFKPD